MQQNQVGQYEKIRIGVQGFLWTAGLLIAGSDGNFMPWVNGVGLLLFAVSSLFLARQTLGMALKPRLREFPRFDGKSGQGKKQAYSFILPVAGR